MGLALLDECYDLVLIRVYVHRLDPICDIDPRRVGTAESLYGGGR